MTSTPPRPTDTWHTRATTRRATRTVRVWASATLAGAAALAALLVPLLAPLDQQAVDLTAKLLAPSADHPFGTDELGRDILLRSVHG
ncbi:ABC transporter permease, partial [Streptomyces sp. NPDC059853]